ncbi:hypothetical protein Trydic_g642 [Trypoxylus dichotomus]
MLLEGGQQEWHSSTSLVGYAGESDVVSSSDPTHFSNMGLFDPDETIEVNPRIETETDLEQVVCNTTSQIQEALKKSELKPKFPDAEILSREIVNKIKERNRVRRVPTDQVSTAEGEI